MAKNRDVSKYGPSALIQMSLVPNMLLEYNSSLPVRAAEYDGMSATACAKHFKLSRVMIVDFGTPHTLLESVRASSSRVALKVTVVAVSYEFKVYTGEEI